MPETMRREDEARLVRALAAVADDVNDGTHPDRAIEKAARAHGVPPGHVPLMVNALNIGRTTRQREDGGTVAEKAADFDLASASTVLDRLFPPAVKSAAAARAMVAVSPEYASPPDWYTRPREMAGAATMLEKVADHAAHAPPPVATKAAGSEEWFIRRAQSDRDRLDRFAAEARLSVTMLEDRLMQKLAAIAASFRDPSCPSMADVRENVAILHGDAGTAVLGHVARRATHLEKAASRRPNHLITPGLEPYASIAEALGLVRDLEVDRGVYAKAAERAERAASSLAPPPPLPPSVLDRPLDGEKSATVSGGIGYAMGQGALERVGRGLVPPDPEKNTARILREIASPEHEQELAAIEARAHLSELLNDDDVLRGHDPREVADHYNRIGQFAPRASRHPLMTVPLVRRSVQQGHLDPFDAGQLADVENKLRPHELLKPEQPGGQKYASASVLGA